MSFCFKKKGEVRGRESESAGTATCDSRLHNGGHGSELQGQLPLRSLIAVCRPADRQLKQKTLIGARSKQQHGKQTTNRMSRQRETSNRFNLWDLVVLRCLRPLALCSCKAWKIQKCLTPFSDAQRWTGLEWGKVDKDRKIAAIVCCYDCMLAESAI